MEGATGTGKVVEGADVDIGASVDGPGTKGDAQDLGQTPGMVAKYIPQVAKDGKLGIVLADVFVDEREDDDVATPPTRKHIPPSSAKAWRAAGSSLTTVVS